MRHASPALPDPRIEPLLSVARAGALLGWSRAAAYRRAKLGDLPTLRVGRNVYVVTARLREMVGLSAEPASDPASAA